MTDLIKGMKLAYNDCADFIEDMGKDFADPEKTKEMPQAAKMAASVMSENLAGIAEAMRQKGEMAESMAANLHNGGDLEQ